MPVSVSSNNIEITTEIFAIVFQHENYINLISYFSGFIGTVLIYCYGIPNQIDTGGKITLVLEQEDEEEKIKIKKFRRYANTGLLFIALSFLIQVLLSALKIA
ncbi:hypothetical protein [Legionella sainthelensi]|uniref:Uncharacterized protein n=1 Tax=Legionella sainthelensi TaxID=28087 RepID=A0A2H5FRS5_9GAMM|nr:hypothetical protein [Legionella sainthelensi]AUH74262.1 hypothetical protein CAB17_20195 [Legionella sainthelensi]